MANNNYLIYPTKTLNWSNVWTGHKSFPHTDIPWDECAYEARDWLYCPCDQMKVSRISNSGGNGTKNTNVFWLESTSPVNTPSGEFYVTIMIIHCLTEDLSKLKVGQLFGRGDQIIQEGDAGYASGYHFHMAVATGTSGRMSGASLVTNGKNLYPYQAFYINQSITENGYYKTSIRSALGYANKFTYLPSNIITNPPGTASGTSIRIEPKRITDGIRGVDFYNSTGLTGTELLKDSSYKFALLKCGLRGWGSQGTLSIDDSFEEFYNQLHGKLPIGVWWWPTCITQEEADKEAEYLINTVLAGKTLEYPVYLDVEGHERWFFGSGMEVDTSRFVNNMSWSKLGTFMASICQKIEQAGYCPGVYANSDFFEHSDFLNQIKQYRLWFAWYPYSVESNKNAWEKWTYNTLSSFLKEKNLSNIIDQIDFWQPGYCTVNGSSASKVDADLLFTSNLAEYVQNYNGNSSFVYINYKKYYAKKADSEEIEKEFTDFLEAIAWIDNQNKGITVLSDKYFLYNENNTIAYPYNVKLYQISEKDKITLDSDILNKCILLETAYNKLQKLTKENKKTYYIINSKNQAIYTEDENGIKDLYVVRTLLEDNYMGSDITQTCNSQFKGYCWQEWKNLEDKFPGKYGVFKIIGLEKSELIYPVDYFYRIYKGTKQESAPLIDLKYSSRNLQSLINICNKLGYQYYIYNENTQSIEYQIDPSFFLPNDIVGLVGNENNDEYKIDSINSEGEVNLYKIISSEEDGDHFEDTPLTGKTIYDLYPIRTQISSDNNSDFFINLLYTHLKDKNGVDTKEAAFNDILEVTKCVYMKNNSSNEEDLIPHLVGKLKSKITGEIIDDTIYYLPYSYLTKILEES